METKRKNNAQEEIDKFIFRWHDFPFDYWWRKKYKIPFGSQAHREMNFIDMYIEYREEFLLNKAIEEHDKSVSDREDKELGLKDGSEKRVIKMTKQEIDDDFENLDLSQFDK